MTTKFPSPLLGYNNNVRHKGKVFHIQTEDSGARYGHIITHLFMDGGRILKSVKTSYAEYVGTDRMADVVREMMKQQHKAMFIALRDGKFDAIAEGATEVSLTTRAVVAESPVPVPAIASAPTMEAPRAAMPAPVPAPDPVVAQVPFDEAPPTLRQPKDELTLDIGALERAATTEANSPLLRSQSELPPPPSNLFRDKGDTGKYRLTPAPPAAAQAPRSPSPAPRRPSPAPRSPSPAPARPAPTPGQPVRRGSSTGVPAGGERRYAPTRPAAIFGQSRPQKSVFGEDLISDKSLDEVILSYLAEDLDDKKK